ncbi:MAG: BREX-2 system phosphatase PglZ, partial [Planctomycetota bacterium]|nr:BREX-2 system phosphatase PglZ [Planctomycetota bacterium]
MNPARADDLLRQLIRRGFEGSSNGYLLVLDRPGLEHLPERVEVGPARYDIRRCGTELELRYALHKLGGAPLVAIVPDALASRLPPDLTHRARKRRVFALEIGEVLAVHLGARVVEVDDEELGQLVLQHLDRMHAELNQRTLPTVVNRALLEELILDATLGRGVRHEAPESLLARWLSGELSVPTGPLRSLMVSCLEREGEDGRALAWALAQDRLRDIVVHGAVLSVADEHVAEGAWEAVRPVVAKLGLGEKTARGQLVTLAEGALRALAAQRRVPKAAEVFREMLDAADTVARRALPAASLGTSELLRLGLQGRLATLASEASRGEAIAPDRVSRLRRHLAHTLLLPVVELVEAMARLARYLASPEPSSDEVATLVERYLRHGAWADVAAAQLQRRMAATSEFHAEAQQLLEAHRTRRDAANLRFAKLLASDYTRHLHTGVSTLHQLSRDYLRPALTEGGVFLVVLDGLSVAVSLELIRELAEDHTFPVGIPAQRAQAGMYPCVAPLPTITSHARGALFLGEVPGDELIEESRWRAEREATTDPARLQRNKALGKAERMLFLKGDLADGGRRLLDVLADKSVELVAAVFNAIDDQIGSKNTGARVSVHAAEIAGLKPAITKALESGRKVLLTADHGHTPFVSKDLRTGDGPAPRYVALEPGEPVPQGFLEIPLQLLGPRGQRLAFAWKMGAYRGMPQAGFHGGASLEEVVVPLTWLVRDGTVPDEPAWWLGQDVPPAPIAVEEEQPVWRTEEPAPKPAARPTVVTMPLFPSADERKGQLADR